MNVAPLRKLGLTEGEISVYIALNTLGETTVGPIIHESNISASKVYDILDRLAKKGLVTHILKEKTKHFMTAHPTKLTTYLHELQTDLELQEKELQKLVAELQVKRESTDTTDVCQVYDGLKGIQNARERSLEVLKEGEEMWIIGISKSPYAGSMNPFFQRYHKLRYEKGIKCNYLYNADAKNPFGKRSATYPHSQVRYMQNGATTNSWIEIYADTVTIGNNEGKSFSVVIQNQEVANSFKTYAKMMWSQSKK